ncbi:G-type lectin S-receptor-like serine/threonine-protein kinase SD2-2 [Coffea arabica]|uniref:Receptor-like serine/threonine-protein kinase n=1 Tax=Coffea arabica TaxID=13443 RepID=A0A6P6WJ38_COFAR|nr:G-type lectin S-receptor-like serine/threonine-protein kinase SD2-2 [Coffea arabica]XP_027115230.1 G-type lectin S-receptor-like serine/threonine-protein kinase SD2-2 [Coffea arabica]
MLLELTRNHTKIPKKMPTLSLILPLLLISTAFALSTTAELLKSRKQDVKPSHLSKTSQEFRGRLKDSIKLESLQRSRLVLAGNTTIFSENRTFELGFFRTDDESKWYLGIWYASIPTPTYVWVANRENPIKNLTSASVEITQDGKLALKEEDSRTIIWESDNLEKAIEARLLEQGNLVLYSSNGDKVWQSFDYPTDTWLPGMNLTADQLLTCWKSSNDPSPGKYSLRLMPLDYGEIALVYTSNDNNSTNIYWSTGNWTGNAFSGVPEMTVPYIYRFHFGNPFTPMASFGYTEVSLDNGLSPPLTRFQVDHTGQLKQFTWSPQSEYWNMFWSQPENLCRVYALCGNFGFCNAKLLSPCSCLMGFKPVDDVSWDAGDFSNGCRRQSGDVCGKNDGFEDAGVVSYEGAVVLSFTGTRSECEKMCIRNCSCIGLHYNERANLCKNLYGSLLNLRNLTSDSTLEEKLYLRVPGNNAEVKNKMKLVLLEAICGFLVILVIGVIVLLFLRRRRRIKKRKQEEEEEGVFPVTNLKVFSYKELHAATKGFSDKLGHGGFGAVFQGELSDSTLVAVKRLEKPGGGEKEFRAEVCTIGNIQHVNLVRLRGFCSENSHRLLVYDFMPNGPLSVYLRRDGKNLSWDARFRIAIGTARGIAYLHEECRNCIIHCDIKPENILLDEDFSAKVSDFGLAKLIGRDFSRVLATMRGTWGYVAPEWISGVAITTKADVYSYGMTLLELLGGRRNVEGPPSAGGGGGVGTEKWFFPPWAAREIIEGNVAAVVDERLGNIYNIAEAQRAALVAVWCIQDDESIRPTMGMVVKMLEGVVEVTVPPPPKLLQALVSGESFHGVGVDSSSKVYNDDGGVSDDNGQLSMNSKDSRSSV